MLGGGDETTQPASTNLMGNDMMDLFGGSSTPATSQPQPAAGGSGDLMDLLGGLDMGGPPV